MSKKIYVLDTNVIMSAGVLALTSFQDNEIVIPYVVIQELENLRLADGVRGMLARRTLRSIDDLLNDGAPDEGVIVNKQGGTLRVEMNHIDPSTLTYALHEGKTLKHLQAGDLTGRVPSSLPNDIRIIAVANNLQLDEKNKAEQDPTYHAKEVIIVTNDLPMRIKIKASLNMRTRPFYTTSAQFSGFNEVFVNDDVIDELYKNRKIQVEGELKHQLDKLSVGECNSSVHLKGFANHQHSALAIKTDDELRLVRTDLQVGKLHPKNREQKIALDYLNDDAFPIVSIGGKAGTGKTLLTVASAISQMAQENTPYNKTYIIRPIFPLGGQDMGFLPGDLDDKMAPWVESIYKTLESVIERPILEEAKTEGKLEVCPATYLRGTTFRNSYVIVDEAQNFDTALLLNILSRVGENTKIVFLWDAQQVDNNRIVEGAGIVSAVDKLKGNQLFAHISMKKSERSQVAELAGNLLGDFL